MEYRTGKCSQCGAEYQVPASFAHNVARCKKCRDGVVHFASLRSPAPSGAAVATAPATLAAREAPPAPRAQAATSAGPERGSAPVAPAEREPARESGAGRRTPPGAKERAALPPTGADQPGSAPARGGRLTRTAVLGLGLVLAAALLAFLFFRGKLAAADSGAAGAGVQGSAPAGR